MINNYEIKKINGEEILYLYFDIDSEFGKISSIGNLKDKVNEFIKKNKIAFKGTTVALVVSGILVGNVFLDSQKEVKNYNTIDNIVEVINNPIEDINTTIEKVLERQEEIKSENIKKEENVVTPIIEPINPVINQQSTQVIDNNIYVNIKRKSGIIKLELEEYVIGVVAAEMPASFSIEALKAQAILARTYALKAINNNRTLTDNSSTQNYKDNNELKNMWGSSYDNYYNKVKNAVDITKGMYLSYNGDYIEALYHSTSNGRTESSINVWGNSYPYLVSVNSPYDNTNPSFIKEQSIDYQTLSSKLKMDVTNETEFNILNRTIGDRVASIEVNGKIYKGVDFRNLLGLRCADFEIEKKEDKVIFKTKGYGHGVGMSQYGANGMAKNGFDYKSILLHYYKGVSISHL